MEAQLRESWKKEDLKALEKGLPNLLQHVENITKVYGLTAVVAINRFPADTEAELDLVEKKCGELGVKAVLSEVWGKRRRRRYETCGGSGETL